MRDYIFEKFLELKSLNKSCKRAQIIRIERKSRLFRVAWILVVLEWASSDFWEDAFDAKKLQNVKNHFFDLQITTQLQTHSRQTHESLWTL